MKKKIKDLTLEECQKICDKHLCQDCPINFPHLSFCHLIALEDVDKEREVEVDE